MKRCSSTKVNCTINFMYVCCANDCIYEIFLFSKQKSINYSRKVKEFFNMLVFVPLKMTADFPCTIHRSINNSLYNILA